MSEFRRVTGQLSVSPQISVADVDDAKAQGFAAIINNRPDGESADQPAGAEIEAAAKAAGLAYAYIPIVGAPTKEQVDEARAEIAKAGGPVLMFCRSGTRSIITWSVGQAIYGDRSRPELVQLGRDAGYDLTQILPLE
jgi:uncharacterized protein (TIGR01244 family)